jgi:hypothetical protein
MQSFDARRRAGQAFRSIIYRDFGFGSASDTDLTNAILLSVVIKLRHVCRTMKKTLLILAPLSMLALAACNKSETPAADAEGDAATAAATAEPLPMPPSITASKTYRCADSTVLYVDYLGANEAADIRVGTKTATAVRVNAPKAEPNAAPAPAGAMKSEDGQTSLSMNGTNVNVKLADKGAQSCKGN